MNHLTVIESILTDLYEAQRKINHRIEHMQDFAKFEAYDPSDGNETIGENLVNIYREARSINLGIK